MTLVTLSSPPGFYANGAVLQASGRWFDGGLVRFSNGTIQPWKGWVTHGDAVLGDKARSIISWTDNVGVGWIACGAASALYAVSRLGDVYDITPDDLAPGNTHAYSGGGYGSGDYDRGDYGVSGGSAELVQPATIWSLDSFGENLIGLNNADGRLFKWERDTDPGGEAAVVSGAPENNRALVVTEQGHVMLLGSGGDRRRVAWSDAQDETAWTPGLPSEAGNFPLQTGGALMCGKRTRGGTLLLTNQDAWLATYNGGANPFSFDQVAVGCGAISQGAAAVAGTTLVAWMGTDGFWTFDGSVQPLPCEVLERVFGDFSTERASHVTAYHKRRFHEIVWHYTSKAVGADNDRYVCWNYRENHWTTGHLARTCGADEGAFGYPLKVDPDGKVWRHEIGFDYVGATTPWIESGPVQFAADDGPPGSRVFSVQQVIPDERAFGQVFASFYNRFTPTGAETMAGPYDASLAANVRFTTRHMRVRLTGEPAADWRIGDFKFDITLGGPR